MTRVLFTSVYRPFGLDDKYNCVTAPIESFRANMGDEGIFSLRYLDPSYPLQFIAKNLKTKSVVLDYPTRNEFIKEIKNNYDYICISFIGLAFEKLKDMSDLIRKLSANTKIVIGGYGSVIPGIEKYGDYICLEEGISFMKKLLKEKQTPVIHPIWEDFNVKSSFMGVKINTEQNKPKVLVVSLGCDGGCEFCSTCHFYNVKKIYLLNSAQEIFDAIQKTDNNDLHINDEDFLKNKPLVLELGELIKKNNKKIELTCMATAKSASQYTPKELLEASITGVWIAVESKFAQYQKLKGVDLKKLTNSFNSHGIHTVLSSILGYDFHTKEKLEEDINYFFSLNPTFAQVLIYTPPPGTPLYKKLTNEKRLLQSPWKEYDGGHLVFKHPHLSKEYLEEFKKEVKKRELIELGPSIYRVIQLRFNNYMIYKNSDNEFLRDKAILNGNVCHSYLPFFKVAKYFVGKKIRKKINRFINEIISEKGKMNWKQKLTILHILFTASFYHLKIKLFGNKPLQPDTMRVEYN